LKWPIVEQRLLPTSKQREQNEPESSNPPKTIYRLIDFPNAALALTSFTKWITKLAPQIGALVDDLACLSPTLLTGATAFLHFTDQILPILRSMIQCEESNVQLRDELKVREQEVAQLKYERIHEKALKEKWFWELKFSQESDQLSLPLDKGKGIEESTP